MDSLVIVRRFHDIEATDIEATDGLKRIKA